MKLKNIFIKSTIFLLAIPSFTSCNGSGNNCYIRFETTDGKQGGVTTEDTNIFKNYEESFDKDKGTSSVVYPSPIRGYEFLKWELQIDSAGTFKDITKSLKTEDYSIPALSRSNIIKMGEITDSKIGTTKNNPFVFRVTYKPLTNVIIRFEPGDGVDAVEGTTVYQLYEKEKVSTTVSAILKNPVSYRFSGWYSVPSPEATATPFCKTIQWEMIDFEIPFADTTFYAVAKEVF